MDKQCTIVQVPSLRPLSLWVYFALSTAREYLTKGIEKVTSWTLS